MDVVRDYLLSNLDIKYVDYEVFNSCYSTIKPWLNISVLVPYLMKHGLAKPPDDMKMLTSPFYPPDVKHTHLFTLAQNGGRHGFMILYRCLRESMVECPLGHGDAVKEIDKCARQRNVVPLWEREETDYRVLTSSSNDGGTIHQESESLTPSSSTSSPSLSSRYSGEEPPVHLTLGEQLGRGHSVPTRRVEHVSTTYQERMVEEGNQGSTSKQYTKNRTTYQMQNSTGNPNPVTTAPQEESLPDLSHSDVTHLLPPSVAVASGMGRPTSSSSSSSSSYSLMPGTGAGRGYSDDERDSVEDTLKNLEEKTQKMHESNITSLKKDMNLTANLSNNSCYLVADSASKHQNLQDLKCRVSQFVVATMNSRNKTQSGVLTVGVDPVSTTTTTTTESESTEYVPTGLPYLKENAAQEIFEHLHASVCLYDNKDTCLDLKVLRAMVKMDVVSVLPLSTKASPAVSVLIVTVSPCLKACRDLIFQECVKDETGQSSRKLYRLISEEDMGTEIVELVREKVGKLQNILKKLSTKA